MNVSRLSSVEELIEALIVKAWASTRWSKGKTPDHHVCSIAANKLRELAGAPQGFVAVALVREVFSRHLNLHYDQRAYSWHEIQHALKEIEDAAKSISSAAAVKAGDTKE